MAVLTPTQFEDLPERAKWAKYVLAIIVFSIVAYLLGYSLFFKPARDYSTSGKVVDIQKGATLRSIASNLESAGLIRSSWAFELTGRVTGLGERLKAGEYMIYPHMSIMDILYTLNDGKVILYPITFPEGLNIREVANLLQAKDWASSSEVMTLAKNRDFMSRYNMPWDNFEGYLLPETYYFPKGTIAFDIIDKMITTFMLKVPDELLKKGEKFNLTPHEVVTLASIIEKETGVVEEKPLISSVFHNRLKKGMRLQSDPTVIYGIPDFNGNLTKTDLLTPTPYNTYTNPGLPPGPICNPGLDTIKAAVEPANTDYLFFVAMGNGHHAFSATLAEHNANVSKYQLGGAVGKTARPNELPHTRQLTERGHR